MATAGKYCSQINHQPAGGRAKEVKVESDYAKVMSSDLFIRLIIVYNSSQVTCTFLRYTFSAGV